MDVQEMFQKLTCQFSFKTEALSVALALLSASLALMLIHIYILVILQGSYAKWLIISATQLGEQL